MLEIKKSYVVDENQNPIAVQIPLDSSMLDIAFLNCFILVKQYPEWCS